jgi:hypothetical protein
MVIPLGSPRLLKRIEMLTKGDRVSTPLGNGSVLWKRMLGPDYRDVDSYSIELDSKKAEALVEPFPFYNGTIFPAEEVQAED